MIFAVLLFTVIFTTGPEYDQKRAEKLEADKIESSKPMAIVISKKFTSDTIEHDLSAYRVENKNCKNHFNSDRCIESQLKRVIASIYDLCIVDDELKTDTYKESLKNCKNIK